MAMGDAVTSTFIDLGIACNIPLCQVDNLGLFVVLWRKGSRVLAVGQLLVRQDGKVADN